MGCTLSPLFGEVFPPALLGGVMFLFLFSVLRASFLLVSCHKFENNQNNVADFRESQGRVYSNGRSHSRSVRPQSTTGSPKTRQRQERTTGQPNNTNRFVVVLCCVVVGCCCCCCCCCAVASLVFFGVAGFFFLGFGYSLCDPEGSHGIHRSARGWSVGDTIIRCDRASNHRAGTHRKANNRHRSPLPKPRSRQTKAWMAEDFAASSTLERTENDVRPRQWSHLSHRGGRGLGGKDGVDPASLKSSVSRARRKTTVT